MFETDYTSTKNGELLPEGRYECVIKQAHINATKGGALYFSVRLVVRNDVPQKYQNKNIYHTIWQKKPDRQTEDDKKVDGYSFKQLMNLCEMAGLPGGKSYETLNDLGTDLLGRPVQAEIIHDTYQDKKSERVKWFSKTAYPDCKHTDKAQTGVSAGSAQPTDSASVDIFVDDDGDLPF